MTAKEFCNPLNLEYKYQHYHDFAHRESADPTVVYFKGIYYMFASMSAGFYYSDDLIDWHYHENKNLEPYDYAPDVCVLGDYLVFCASSKLRTRTFFRTKAPLSDVFEPISVSPFNFHDPDLFVDDDGRVYFYWGCDCGLPIYGVELDRETLMPISDIKSLIYGDYKNHGCERKEYPGMPIQPLTPQLENVYNEMKEKGLERAEPFIEGAYMNKINGKYYLQYAAPATELETYGNGVYISSSPLGPFEYQSHNPLSSKPSGFINGAGHGSTAQDTFGNWWHAATMCISNNAMFERRLGFFSAGIDEDGILYCNQNYADWPMEIPEGKFDCRKLSPKWMLLSYKKSATALSCIDGHTPEMALNENIKSSWCAKECKNEWFMLDLGDIYDVHSIQINFQDVEVPLKNLNEEQLEISQKYGRYIDSDKMYTRYILEGSLDKKEWFVLSDKREADSDLAHDYLILGEKRIRYIKITAIQLPYNKRFALSGLRVFGKEKGDAPCRVENVEVTKIDETTAKLSWNLCERAFGYNIRYGIAPDKLYSNYMVYSDNGALIILLNSNTQYYFCVDSFGEGGITEGEICKM